MKNPLYLFIKPKQWKRVYGYGDKEKQLLTRSHTLLEKVGGGGELYAAIAGTLTARLPGSGVNPTLKLTDPAAGVPLPSTVNLYLHIWPTMQNQLPLDKKETRIGQIIGFAYLNVDTATLEASLGVLLDQAVLGGSLTRQQVVQRLVLGELGVRVCRGHLIGKAAQTPGGKHRVGFAVLTENGPVDPAYIYNELNTEYSQDLSDLTTLLKEQWPVIKKYMDANAAVNETKVRLYHMPTLNDLRTRYSMTYKQWRQVGDNQKGLWRQLLLARVGHAPYGSTAPPFDFDLLDWRNLFQLEALVEFYANFDDPWLPGAIPRKPTDPNYIKVNFLNPFGTSAKKDVMGNPKRIILDGVHDLSRVKEKYDMLYLDKALFGTNAFRIEKVVDKNTIELDNEPIMTDISSAWRISLSTILVLIDPFGPRIHGYKAKDVGGQTVRLKDCSKEELKRVNRYFDTVYFPVDTGRPSHTFRITERDADLGTITLDKTPSFGIKESDWYIQSGVSTESPPLYYDLGSGGGNYRYYPHRKGYYGYDHFDGVIFVLKNDRVHAMYRWSSFTSRINYSTPEHRSSVRGNRQYDFSSLRCGKNHLNYCFKVFEKGKNERTFRHVRSARFYFAKDVKDDSVAPGTPYPWTGAEGKKNIMIHWSRSKQGQKASGRTGVFKNSAGCMVSPLFEQFRAKLIELRQEDYPDQRLKKITRLLDHYESERENARRWAWNYLLKGSLWVIRPDERFLSP